MKKRLFSKKDGTSFFEDLKSLFADVQDSVRYFFDRIFGNLRNWYDIAGEPVVVFLEGLKAVIDENVVTGSIFDAIVASTKTPLDNIFLEWLRDNLPAVIAKWQGIPQVIDETEQSIDDILGGLDVDGGVEYMVEEIGFEVGVRRNALIHSFASVMIEEYTTHVAKASGASPITGVHADTFAQVSYDLYKERNLV
jgi:hypothetical protein